MLALVFGLGLSSSAVAADPKEMVALRWTRGEGAANCADGPTLERRVEARLGRPAFRDDATKVLVAEVERTGFRIRTRPISRAETGPRAAASRERTVLR